MKCLLLISVHNKIFHLKSRREFFIQGHNPSSNFCVRIRSIRTRKYNKMTIWSYFTSRLVNDSTSKKCQTKIALITCGSRKISSSYMSRVNTLIRRKKCRKIRIIIIDTRNTHCGIFEVEDRNLTIIRYSSVTFIKANSVFFHSFFSKKIGNITICNHKIIISRSRRIALFSKRHN